MIYTYQIIDGFEALLGPEIIHIPMLVTLLAIMGYPDDATEEQKSYLRRLYWYSAFFHGFCSLHHLLKRAPSKTVPWMTNITQNLAIFLIVGQGYLIITSTTLVIYSYQEEEKETFTDDQKKWQFWAFLELFTITGITISAILFNLLRFLMPTRIYIYYLHIALPHMISPKQISKLWRPGKIGFPKELLNDESACKKKL